MESVKMDAAVVGALASVAGAMLAGLKIIYTRVTKRTDRQVRRLETKLDKCEAKHQECQEQHVVMSSRLSFIEGHLQGEGVDVPQQG